MPQSQALQNPGPLALYRDHVAQGALEIDPAQHAALEALDALHAHLRQWTAQPFWRRLLRRRPPVPDSLYLYGPVGRGKSMLMDLFVEAAPVSARRVHFHAFMQEVHATLHEWRQMDEKERRAVGFTGDDPVPPLARHIAGTLRLLCLDELEIQDIADAMIVGRLFTALLAESVVVVITSNRHPEELYQGGINRQLFRPFIDLVSARFTLVKLESPRDFRLDAGPEPHYLSPLGPETRAEMDAIFEHRRGGRIAAPATLTVKGRAIRIPAAAGQVARFDFADLCEAPLGQGDYLALAERFTTIMLDDIPVMQRQDRNAARRFITLIDVLYDKGVELICSAAAPPEELYREGDGTIEFARTASRLREMARGPKADAPAGGP